MERLDYCIQGQGHRKGSKCECFSRWCILTTNDFVTELGIVMHYYELEWHAKRLVCYLEGQSDSKGSYDQSMTVYTMFSELLILLLPNLV